MLIVGRRQRLRGCSRDDHAREHEQQENEGTGTVHDFCSASRASWRRFCGVKSSPTCNVETQTLWRSNRRTSEECTSAFPVWDAATTPKACQSGRSCAVVPSRKSSASAWWRRRNLRTLSDVSVLGLTVKASGTICR